MKSTFYKSSAKDIIFLVTSRVDKLGEIYFYIEYKFGDTEAYCRFKELSSLQDFIKSNF